MEEYETEEEGMHEKGMSLLRIKKMIRIILFFLINALAMGRIPASAVKYSISSGPKGYRH